MAKAVLDIPSMLGDPVGTLKRAREAGWLADLGDGGVAVMAHDQIRELLTHPNLRANFVDFMHTFGVTSGPFHDWMAISPLNRDGAEHQRFRSIMSRTFTPRSVERLRPFLRQSAHDLIDGFADHGHCEFVAEFADAYPSLGLCELIGVPLEDRDRFRGWANTIGLGFNPIDMGTRIAEIDAALTQLLAYTAELAARRKTEPRDDLVSRIAAAGAADGWSDYEVQSLIAGLVFAGHETTKNQLGWMMFTLAEAGEVWEQIAAGRSSVEDVIEEVVRYRSAVTALGRTVVESFEHNGERLPANTRVLFSLWSADQDATAFPRADSFDPAANGQTPHFAFGHGAHHCIGAALARAELQDALSVLTARMHTPVLAEGVAWKPPLGITGPERLPITFSLRGA